MMMAYISASPFVYQHVVGLSEVEYGVAFGVNAAGLITAGWVASRLVDRVEPRARSCAACDQRCRWPATLTFVVLAAAGRAGLDCCRSPIFVAVASNGGIMGNSAALAMSQVREVAGTGSAVLGFSQFALGALVSPLVGLGGEDSAVVPAIVMASASCWRSREPAAHGAGQSSSVLDVDRDVVEQAAAATPRPGPSRAGGASGPPR